MLLSWAFSLGVYGYLATFGFSNLKFFGALFLSIILYAVIKAIKFIKSSEHFFLVEFRRDEKLSQFVRSLRDSLAMDEDKEWERLMKHIDGFIKENCVFVSPRGITPLKLAEIELENLRKDLRSISDTKKRQHAISFLLMTLSSELPGFLNYCYKQENNKEIV
jgi:hypothetical protein